MQTLQTAGQIHPLGVAGLTVGQNDGSESVKAIRSTLFWMSFGGLGGAVALSLLPERGDMDTASLIMLGGLLGALLGNLFGR